MIYKSFHCVLFRFCKTFFGPGLYFNSVIGLKCETRSQTVSLGHRRLQQYLSTSGPAWSGYHTSCCFAGGQLPGNKWRHQEFTAAG